MIFMALSFLRLIHGLSFTNINQSHTFFLNLEKTVASVPKDACTKYPEL